MQLKIMQAGEPALRQPARALSNTEILSAPIQQLIELMRATLYDAPGVGLAAPQIGESLQIAVIEDKESYHQGIPSEELARRERVPIPFHVIINPKISVIGTDTMQFFEGCLSHENFVGLTPRYLAVKVECLNEHAESVVINARGWYARILQHEIDHLRGTLYLDHVKTRTLMTTDNYLRYWCDKTVEQICSILNV